MPYNILKRSGVDSSKASPLKVVSPIIRKYAEQRQKRTRISGKKEKNQQTWDLKAILPKEGSFVSVEPDLILSVNPSVPSTITVNSVPAQIAQPAQEICMSAKLVRPSKTSRKRSGLPSKQKMIKQGKLVESAFELLKPEPFHVANAREQAYTQNYIRKVQATFSGKEESIFQQFCAKLAELETEEASVVNVYKDISELFSGHADLIEDFLPFLTAEQALECGVFMNHLMATKMTEFLALVDAHFGKSPHQIRKIHTALEKLLALPEIDMKEVCSVVLPLLKGNAVLTDFFLELLPCASPREPLPTDFEELDEEGMSDGSEEGRHDMSERLELPTLPDPYGGANCICCCHESVDDKYLSRAQHCIPCSTKFINGKIFIQSGKLLRRATVTFSDHDMDYHRLRLLPHPGEPRKRKRSSCTSPSKSANASSDDHRSDMDDEEKSLLRCWPKTPRSRSGKSSGKGAGKFIEVDSYGRDRNSKKSLKFSNENMTKISPIEKRLKLSECETAEEVHSGEIVSNSLKVNASDRKSKNKRQNKEIECFSPTFNASNIEEPIMSPKGIACMGVFCIERVASTGLSTFSDDITHAVAHSDKPSCENSTFITTVLSPYQSKIAQPSSHLAHSADEKPDGEGADLSRWKDAGPTVGDTVSFISVPELLKEEVKSPFSVSLLSPKQETSKCRWPESDVPTGSDTVSFITLSKDESKSVLASAVLSPKQLPHKSETERQAVQVWHDMEVDKLSLISESITYVATPVVLIEENLSSLDKNSLEEVQSDTCPLNLGQQSLNDVIHNLEPPGLNIQLPTELSDEAIAETIRLSPPVISIPESGNMPLIIDPLLNAIEGSTTGPSDKINGEEGFAHGPDESTTSSLVNPLKYDNSNEIAWKLEEDRVILYTLQTETYCEETFVKIGDALPSRTLDAIKKRFQELLNILYKMKTEAPET